MNPRYRLGLDSITILVKVQPKSRRPGVQGWVADIEGERLRIGVSEAAEDGLANRAVCTVLARVLDVSAAAVSVVQGATSRQKIVRIVGEPAALAQRIEALAQQSAD